MTQRANKMEPPSEPAWADARDMADVLVDELVASESRVPPLLLLYPLAVGAK